MINFLATGFAHAADAAEPATDLLTLFLREINKGSVLAIMLLTLFVVVTSGLVAEAISKAQIESPIVRDRLALIEATGKVVAALTGLAILGYAASKAVGASAVNASFFVAVVIAFSGFAVATVLVYFGRLVIRKLRSPSGTPPVDQSLVEICRSAEVLANKAQQVINAQSSPIYPLHAEVASESEALEKQLKSYKSRAKKLTGLLH